MSFATHPDIRVRFPESWRTPKAPGYGTFPGPEPKDYEGIDRYKEAVFTAIRNGYRHIDTAQTYTNEHCVGQAIYDSKVVREEIFLTSKLHPDKNSYDGALNGIKESQSELNTHIDLYLIHYPGEGDAIEAWKGLIKARAEEICQHIGVSNFEIHNLERLREETGEYPEVNQIEFHPLLFSGELMNLVQFCKGNGIQVEGYCPLAEGNRGNCMLLNNNDVKMIADTHECSPARVILKWCLQHDVRPIVGSLDPAHISEDNKPYSFQLTGDEMKTIDALGRGHRISKERWGWDPTFVKL